MVNVGDYFLSRWNGRVTLFRCTRVTRTGRPVANRWHKSTGVWVPAQPQRQSNSQPITLGEARRLMKSHKPYTMGAKP
jgi:hypothetical protein